ncbi:bifunctional transcriptional activator/DNA repair enzyme AdaA [Paenibacillus sp. MBLB4367]|uniref:bifunctional transcriptional activator/DNA repair enzyme AdaA n=1 Tax=Paenibacillus sp. MBLB4367 TaxID=3384767 RepID=UPI003908324A
MIMNDKMWQAIVDNDSSYDGIFYYGVQTTGIFCRPSCKSRVPIRTHVLVFPNAGQALSANFRPCKRCKPEGKRLPDEEWVSQITAWIEAHYAEKLTLGTIAELFHGSPYHLQRTFKRIHGITPAEFIQRTRVEKAKRYLCGGNQPITEIAAAVGVPNAAHFATLFQARTGLSPSAYRQSSASATHQGNGED